MPSYLPYYADEVTRRIAAEADALERSIAKKRFTGFDDYEIRKAAHDNELYKIGMAERLKQAILNQQRFEEQRRYDEEKKRQDAEILKQHFERAKKAERDRDLAIRQAREIHDQIEQDRRKRDEEARRAAHRREAEYARQQIEHEHRMKQYAFLKARPKIIAETKEELEVKKRQDEARRLVLEADVRAEEARRKLFEAEEAEARLRKAEADAQSTRVLIGLKEDNEAALVAVKAGRNPVANPKAKVEALKNHDQETEAELRRLEQKAAVKSEQAEKVQEEAVAIEKEALKEHNEAMQLAAEIEQKLSRQKSEEARENSASKRAASAEKRKAQSAATRAASDEKRKAAPVPEPEQPREKSRSRSRSKPTAPSSGTDGSTAANAFASKISDSLQKTLPVQLANSIAGLTKSEVRDALPEGLNLNVPLLAEALDDSPQVQLDKLLKSGKGTLADVERLLRKIKGRNSSKSPNKYEQLFKELQENKAMIAKLMANLEELKGRSSRPVVRAAPPPRIFVPRMTMKQNKSWFARWFPRISSFFTRRSGGARKFQSRKNILILSR